MKVYCLQCVMTDKKTGKEYRAPREVYTDRERFLFTLQLAYEATEKQNKERNFALKWEFFTTEAENDD